MFDKKPGALNKYGYTRKQNSRLPGATVLALVLLLLFPVFSAVAAPTHASETIQATQPSQAIAADQNAYAPAPQLTAEDYTKVRGVNPRLAVWFAAQMHLWFAAFVLAVPIFVLIIECAGVYTRDARYDALAREFMRVSLTAYSFTAITGALLLVALVVFYPDLMKYLSTIFGPTMLLYALFFFIESAALYVYYYGWQAMSEGVWKKVHLLIGLALNAAGTALMFIANAWVTFMMTPAGVDARGVFDGNVWHAVHNHLWHPMNLHRFIANIAYGGSIVGAYAAYMYLSSRTDEERSHYDWMGYTSSLIAVGALLPLPFAGYWLTAEIYSYSQQMGINLMGGVLAWLFIIQAVVIGALFLAANYYLWCGMQRGSRAAQYNGYIKYIAFVLGACFMVWFTPHTPLIKPTEAAALGGQFHPWLAPLGLMPAKNVAVNIMIIFTYLSFLIYRRSNRVPTVGWASTGKAVQAALVAAAVVNIIATGVYYGYFTNSVYKVASSVTQVASTLIVITGCSLIEYFMHRGAKETGEYGWGRMPARSQYALILIAVSFTWLMGLMGFVRSALRQQWHVYSVMRDASADAATPTVAYAARVVSVGTIVFMAIILFIFWVAQLGGKGSRHD
ncbi:MAG: cytochrome ubiquinol oxidase subunit I [Deltaproteobacteria bacterium]|nr:cytochrome ubiquinol oxidase subunit I [Deltaproteobacteria bacterium]